MPVDVKICGLTTVDATVAAIDAGAFAVGFVFFTPSPRSVSPSSAVDLSRRAANKAMRFGLFVDADDAWIQDVLAEVPLDAVQLHGTETPARVQALRQTLGVPVMKAVGISSRADVVAAKDYHGVVDWLLFDARAPKDATRPGGNAVSFDWSLLSGFQSSPVPWMLAGGLNVKNLERAVAITGAKAVDVSSGVEMAPGQKNAEEIQRFLATAAAI
jgi:phosphoribosylanthranilate isomerase